MKLANLPYRKAHRRYHKGQSARRVLEVADQIDWATTAADCRQKVLTVQPELAKLSSGFWSSLVSHLRNERDAQKNPSIEIDAIKPETLSATDWLRLSTLLIALKCFHEAHLVREHAKSRIRQLKRQLDSPLYCDLIIGLLIENWELRELPEYLRYARLFRTECGRNRASHFIADSLSGKVIRHPNGADQAFQSLLDSRAVAVVGPLELGSQELDEIRQFDLVVGINDTSSLFSNQEESRPRPDILYLAGSVQKRMEQQGKLKLHHEPAVIVGKRNALTCLDCFRSTIFRQNPHYNHFMLNGSLNLMPRAVLDLVLFQPARIKVFGADLYASMRYRKDYGGIAHQSVNTVLRQHVAHDLITQYSVIHNLFTHKALEADCRLEPILKSGLRGYLDIFYSPDNRLRPVIPA